MRKKKSTRRLMLNPHRLCPYPHPLSRRQLSGRPSRVTVSHLCRVLISTDTRIAPTFCRHPLIFDESRRLSQTLLTQS